MLHRQRQLRLRLQSARCWKTPGRPGTRLWCRYRSRRRHWARRPLHMWPAACLQTFFQGRTTLGGESRGQEHTATGKKRGVRSQSMHLLQRHQGGQSSSQFTEQPRGSCPRQTFDAFAEPDLEVTENLFTGCWRNSATLAARSCPENGWQSADPSRRLRRFPRNKMAHAK